MGFLCPKKVYFKISDAQNNNLKEKNSAYIVTEMKIEWLCKFKQDYKQYV